MKKINRGKKNSGVRGFKGVSMFLKYISFERVLFVALKNKMDASSTISSSILFSVGPPGKFKKGESLVVGIRYRRVVVYRWKSKRANRFHGLCCPSLGRVHFDIPLLFDLPASSHRDLYITERTHMVYRTFMVNDIMAIVKKKPTSIRQDSRFLISKLLY